MEQERRKRLVRGAEFERRERERERLEGGARKLTKTQRNQPGGSDCVVGFCISFVSGAGATGAIGVDDIVVLRRARDQAHVLGAVPRQRVAPPARGGHASRNVRRYHIVFVRR